MNKTILQIIKRTLGDEKNESWIGNLGFKILEESNKLDSSENITKDFDSETIKKFNHLRQCESVGDLAWMDSVSWDRVGKDVRLAIESSINPLHWSGIYWQHSTMLPNENNIWRFLNSSCTVFHFRDGNNHRYLCIDNKSTFKFEKLINSVAKLNFVRSISVVRGRVKIHLIGGGYE